MYTVVVRVVTVFAKWIVFVPTAMTVAARKFIVMALTLTVLPQPLAVCRLAADAALPEWAISQGWFCIMRTADELSVVCGQQQVPAGIKAEFGWRALKFEGPFDFSLTGILLAVADPLAQAGISIFALSSYDTDYVLVRGAQFEAAIVVLQQAGHQINQPQL